MAQPIDTIIMSLNDVVVTAENVTLIDRHLLILPNRHQCKQANSGLGVLRNLMQPRLSVETQQGKVENYGIGSNTIYKINHALLKVNQ